MDQIPYSEGLRHCSTCSEAAAFLCTKTTRQLFSTQSRGTAMMLPSEMWALDSTSQLRAWASDSGLNGSTPELNSLMLRLASTNGKPTGAPDTSTRPFSPTWSRMAGCVGVGVGGGLGVGLGVTTYSFDDGSGCKNASFSAHKESL